MIRKVLVVGLGGIGQRHVRNLRSLRGDGVEIVAWRSRGLSAVVTPSLDIEPGADVERKYGIRTLPTLDDALSERPDAVLVCNPSSLHVEVARKALEAGAHVFVEKPLSDSMAGVEELAGLCERSRRVGFVGYQLRFHPLLQRAAAVLEAGTLGPLLSARMVVGEYLPGFHRYEDYRGMYASRRDLGGGVVLSQIHELDLVTWFFGMPRRVFSVGGHLSSLEIDVEDVASSLLVCGERSRAFPVHLLQDYVQRPASRCCEVVGDRGKLFVDLRAQVLLRHDADGNLVEKIDRSDFDRNELFLAQARSFLAAVEEGGPVPVTLRQGAQSLELALAVRRSLEHGLVVDPGGSPA